MIQTVLAIDPGRAKCGMAVISRSEGIRARKIVPVADIEVALREFIANFSPQAIVIGSGTGSDFVAQIVQTFSTPYQIIDENLSTQKARPRYFAEHPPKGWRRLIPRGMLTPQEPYDDYAAVILAEIFLHEQEKAGLVENK